MLGRVLWLVSAFGGAMILLLCLRAFPGAISQPSLANSIIISEVAWSGTAASRVDEWLELYNAGVAPVDLTGWTLLGDAVLATPSGILEPRGFYVLEHWENALIDVTEDGFLLSSLANDGETIQLLDDSGQVVDTANIAGGPWPAGTDDEDRRSMERADPAAIDDPQGWVSNDTVTRNGLDADGRPVNGTPGRSNSSWAHAPGQSNLSVRKTGPLSANPGGTLLYTLVLSNTGQAVADNVILSDTLPTLATYVAHDGDYSFTMPLSGTLNWHIGTVYPSTIVSVLLTVTIGHGYTGPITNTAVASTVSAESSASDNSDNWFTEVISPDAIILIDALHYDGYENQEHDEAVRLLNVGGSDQDLTGWRLGDGTYDAIFPEGVILRPGEGIWIADWATSFRRQFGHQPDYEVRGADPAVPNLEGTWPRHNNAGDEVLLRDSTGILQDVLIYLAGNTGQPGWSGVALEPYVVSGAFAAEGQILYRMRGDDGQTRAPDTDSARDWSQGRQDPIRGRRVRYPGWDIDSFRSTEWHEEPAELVVGVAPDGVLELLRAELAGAQSSLRIASHTFRSAAIVQELIAAVDRGISVTVLLEGNPVGGIDPAELENCRALEQSGGHCWFMINDAEHHIHDRYRYLHAKFIIVDERRAIVSTENLSPDSFLDVSNGATAPGRRGVVVVTDAPSVVSHLLAIWSLDFDPHNHQDLAPWSSINGALTIRAPAAGPIEATAEISYGARYSVPLRISGEFDLAVVQAPEDALGNATGLLRLLAQAGSGDTILVEQLSERPYWGVSSSDPSQDPNPRLEAMIGAARRGATVHLLLDEFFDDPDSPVSNLATCRYVNGIAGDEGLQLRCERANPTGLGLHNKMILAQIAGRGYVFAGSINGTELSNKGNREVAILFQSDAAYSFLADMFWRDWPHVVSLPVIFQDYVGPASHVLISEVHYDPPGPDDAEFVELFNPTDGPMDLTGFSIGDALYRTDFEDVRRFPPGTVLEAGAPLVIAVSASGFNEEFGFKPDYEILDSDPMVPDLIDDKSWGDPATFLQLGNLGDQVLVRDPADRIIDAVAYGSAHAPGNISCPLTVIAGAVLERIPPWRDTNSCPSDFREWPFPSPGAVP